MTPGRDTGRSILGILGDFWTDVRLALRTWRRNLVVQEFMNARP